MFRSLVMTALLAGAAAGLLLTVIQQWQVTPIILAAEKYEMAAAKVSAHEHNSPSDEHSHAHNEAQWTPAEGMERMLYTLLANVFAGIGFALLIAAGMGFSGHSGWRSGLGWGLAGYAVFFLAPTLGLHPEVPGTVAAALAERQLWWISTVAASATGLALLIFGRSLLLRGMAVLLLIMPHLFGAPLPEHASSLVPQQLSDNFILATTIVNGIFWLALGLLCGRFLQRFLPSENVAGV
ncbi:MAG TPA: hypothetical protein ENI98_01685 [Gammaproteobacteria bacterium]|nr:hypothetical protein [Gammaproteobacteria bacterium]